MLLDGEVRRQLLSADRRCGLVGDEVKGGCEGRRGVIREGVTRGSSTFFTYEARG